MTDSGGVQKESYFHKPCIILHLETKWIKVLETGNAILADANYERILSDYSQFEETVADAFPLIFEDGKTAEFICSRMVENTIGNLNNC